MQMIYKRRIAVILAIVMVLNTTLPSFATENSSENNLFSQMVEDLHDRPEEIYNDVEVENEIENTINSVDENDGAQVIEVDDESEIKNNIDNKNVDENEIVSEEDEVENMDDEIVEPENSYDENEEEDDDDDDSDEEEIIEPEAVDDENIVDVQYEEEPEEDPIENEDESEYEDELEEILDKTYDEVASDSEIEVIEVVEVVDENVSTDSETWEEVENDDVEMEYEEEPEEDINEREASPSDVELEDVVYLDFVDELEEDVASYSEIEEEIINLDFVEEREDDIASDSEIILVEEVKEATESEIVNLDFEEIIATKSEVEYVATYSDVLYIASESEIENVSTKSEIEYIATKSEIINIATDSEIIISTDSIVEIASMSMPINILGAKREMGIYYEISGTTLRLYSGSGGTRNEYVNIDGWTLESNLAPSKSVRQSITKIEIMEEITPKYDNLFANYFTNCTSVVGFGYYRTKNCKSLANTFDGMSSLQSIDMSGWDVGTGFDVSAVTNFSYMFNNCSSLSKVGDIASIENGVGDFRKFKTPIGQDFKYMFYGCSSLEVLMINNFDYIHNTLIVQPFGHMFQNCNSLTTIYATDNFKLSNLGVGIANDMFKGCTSLVGENGTTYTNSDYGNDKYRARIDKPGQDGYFTDGTIYTVSFNTNGGSEVESQQIMAKNKATKPVNPTKEHYHLVSGVEWYKENTYQNLWDFDNDKVTSNITLYVKWVGDPVTITFDENSGTWRNASKQTITYEYNMDNPPSLPIGDSAVDYTVNSGDVYKTNYDFIGWYDGEDNQVTSIDSSIYEDYTLKAKWVGRTYKIYYNMGGGSWISGGTNVPTVEPQPFIYDTDTITLPTATDIEKVGNDFLGWYVGSTKWETVPSTTDHDVSLDAKWQPKTYNINFNLDDGAWAVQESTITKQWTYGGSNVNLPTADKLKKEHYTFDCWYDEDTGLPFGSAYVSSTRISDLNLKAHWNLNKHKITYYPNNGETMAQTEWTYGDPDIILPTITREHYIFDGWYDNATDFSSSHRIEGDPQKVSGTRDADIAVYAKWNPVWYTITYQKKNPSDAWTYVDESKVSIGYYYDVSDVELPKEYNGTIEDAAGNIVWENHVFDGWYEVGTNTKYTIIEKDFGRDITLEARWDAAEYNISYTENGGTWLNPDSVPKKWKYGDSGVALPDGDDITKANYDFAGWYDKAGLDNDPTAIRYETIPGTRNQNIQLFAKWVPKKYNIIYHTTKGNFVNENLVTKVVTYGEDDVTLPLSSNMTSTNYIFDGWYDNEECSGTPITIVSKNITEDFDVWAKWYGKTYNIIYEITADVSWAPSYVAPTSYVYEGANVILPVADNISRANYIFDGWVDKDTSESVGAILPSTTNKNITLVPKWRGEPHTITYHEVGGNWQSGATKPEEWEYNTTGTVVLPDGDDIKRDYYIFDGWYDASTGGTKYTSISKSRNTNIELWARWIGVTYTISYNRDGGSWVAGSVATISWVYDESSTEKLILPTSLDIIKTNYVFDGWYIGDTKYIEIPKTRHENITLTARWRGESHTITYHEVGGNWQSGATKPEEWEYDTTGTVVLPDGDDIKRDYYIFDGWYDASTGGTKYTSISKSRNTNIELWARWIGVTYTITYDVDGGAWQSGYDKPTSWVYEEGTLDKVMLPTGTNVTKTNYIFNGWYAGDTKYTEIQKDRHENITLTARWTGVTYNINYDTKGGHFVSTDSVVREWIYASYNITLPTTDIVKEHYAFGGWIDEETGQPISTIVSTRAKDIIVYAKWNPIEYNITYIFGEGATFVTETGVNRKYTYSENAADVTTLPALSTIKKDYYTFDGWYDNPSFSGSAKTNVSRHTGTDVTFYAKWKANTFDITYMLSGDATDPASWVSGYTPPTSWIYASNSVTLPASSSVTRLHYDFMGWYDQATGGTEYETVSSMRTQPITLYARWQGKKYNVSYEKNGGAWASATVEANVIKNYIYKQGEKNLPTADDLVYANHVFEGWYEHSDFSGDKITKIANGISGDIQVYASWSNAGFSITYEVDSDCVWDPSYTKPTSWIYEGEDVILPIEGDITKEHYIFDGWYDSEGNKWTTISSLRDRDITLYARWKGVTYTITYDVAGGYFARPAEVKNSYQYASTSVVVLPKSDNIKKDYHVFNGWYNVVSGQKIIEIDNMTGGEVSVVASWSGATYNVNYALNGGSFINESLVKKQWTYNNVDVTSIELPDSTNMLRANYDFDGWYDASGVRWTSISSDTHNTVNLTARWKGKTYNIIYLGTESCTWKDGYVIPTSWVYGSTSIALPTSTYISKANYIFEGWYVGDTRWTNIPSTTVGPIVLTAKWKGVSHTITYIDGGAVWTGTKPTSWVYNDVDITSVTLPTSADLSREHYIFNGWYENSDYSGSRIYEISSTRYNDIIVYAKWTGEEIDITIDISSGEDWDWDWVDDTYPDEYKQNPIKVEYGSNSVILPTEEQVHKPNYDFEGFFDEDGNRVTEIDPMDPDDRHIKPRFRGCTYEADFDIDGGNWVDESSVKKTWVYASESLILPTSDDVKKDHYVFDGWYYENPIGPGVYNGPITEIDSTTGNNMYLKIKWKGETYKVNYDTKGGTIDPAVSTTWIYASTSAILASTESITKEHYVFAGWYDKDTDERIYEVHSDRGEDIDVYAKWIGQIYSIAFVIDSDSYWTPGYIIPSSYVYEEANVPLPSKTNLTRAGYTLVGWYDNPSLSGNAISVLSSTYGGDVTLYPKWDFGAQTITYVLSEDVYWKEGYTAPTIWKIASDNVILPASGSIIREHYIFDGWYENSDYSGGRLYEIDHNRTTDIVLYDKWVGETYEIMLTFDPDCTIDDEYWERHGYTNPISFVYGSDSIILPDETEVHKPYHNFEGWYDDEGNRYDHITPEDIENNIKLHAEWSLDTRNITYVNHGGVFVDGAYKPEHWVYASDNVVLPTGDDIKREHYVFDGWYESEDYSSSRIIEVEGSRDADLTVHAKWNGEIYNINYDEKGGAFIGGAYKPTSWTYMGANVTLPTASSIERANYIFDGWYDGSGNKITTIQSSRGSSINISAKWNPVTYAIQYELASGSFIDESIVNKTYKYDVVDVMLPIASNMRRSHYHFVGWYDNADYTGTLYTKVAKGDFGVKKFYAKWEGDEYAVNYDLKGGEWKDGYIAPISWIYASTSIILPTASNIEKANYNFVGWKDYETGNTFTMIDKSRNKGISIYAEWEAKTYNIEYELASGSFVDETLVPYNYVYTEIDNSSGIVDLPDGNNTKRDHYIFDGWYAYADYSGGKITKIEKGESGDKKYYAKWKGETYTVHYDTKNGSFVEGYIKPENWIYASTSVVLPASNSITREHYTFDGWYEEISGTKYTVVNKNYNQDIYLYAKWNPLTYKINYHLASGSFVSEAGVNRSYVYSENTSDVVNLPVSTNVKRDNYIFDGWYDNSNYTGSAKTNVSRHTGTDVDYYVKWKANTYNITYELNGDVDDPASWVIDENLIPKSWTYASKSVILPASTSVSRAHYRFVGWYDNNNIEYKTISSTRNQHINLRAKWEALTYNIIYEKNGGNFADESSVRYVYTYKTGNVNLPLSSNISKTNYTFAGWYATDSFVGTAMTEIFDGTSEDVTVYAKWDANVYNITYDFNDDSMDTAGWISGYSAPSSWTYASASVILPASDSIVRNHYHFDGWYNQSDEKIMILDSYTSGDVILKAKWIGETYKVIYHNAGGHFVSTESIVDRWIYNTTNLELPNNTKIEKEHYVFDGWYDAESGGTKYTMISETRGSDIDLYARWYGVTYSVTYDRNGGTWVNPGSVPYEWIYDTTEIILPASDSIVKEHYIFDGWYDEEGNLWTNVDKNVGESISVKARWKGITYHINYHMNGGYFVSTDSEANTWIYDTVGATLPIESGIKRDYYIFDGWYDNDLFDGEQLTSIDKMRGSDIDLYAKWRGVHYNVTYHEQEGHFEIIPDDEWIYDEEGLTLPDGSNIKREHYIFAGWYDNIDCVGTVWTEIDKMRHENIDLYAKWIGDTYHINYHMNDGHFISTVSEPYDWIYASTSIILPASSSIVREHYHFGGWYRNPSFTGDEVTMIDKMEGSDVDLYAKWIGDTYYISFVLNGDDRDPASFVATDTVINKWVYTTSDPVVLPVGSEMIRNHYIFDGWYRDPSFANNTKVTKIYNTEGADVTLYAKWNAITYYVIYTMSAGEFVSTYSEPTEWVYASYSVILPIEGEIVRANYHFDGWYRNGDFTSTRLYEIDKYEGEDVKITAKWIPNTYNINYHMNGGHFISTDSITKQFTYNVSDVPLHDNDITRNNYQFRGWYDNPSYAGDKWSMVSKLNEGDVDLYAKWEPNVYKITYILNGGHFVGTESVITKWTYASNSVVLPASNSTVNGIERTDYHFAGWYDKERFDGARYDILSSYTENDITLYAKWIENTYNIIYVNNGGYFEATSSVIKEWTYNISDAELPRDNNIKREHWIFMGWYDNPSFDGAPYTMISRTRGGGDITLYAKWIGVTYRVTYVENNGYFVDGYDEPLTWQYASTSIILPASDSFVRDHYIFRGWYDTPPTLEVHGTEWTNIDMYYGEDITLYALWEPKVYEIHYVLNDGQWVSTDSIIDMNFTHFTYDGGDRAVPDRAYVKRTNYRFLGWYDNPEFNGEQLTKVSGTHPGDITLYASWIGEEHHIFYNLGAGRWVDRYTPPTTWIYNFQDVTLPNANAINHGGYDFIGWQDANGVVYTVISKLRTEDITLYAKYQLIPDPSRPNRPGAGGAPGKITGEIGVKKEISSDILNSLNETAADLIQHNPVVQSAIDILPVSILIVRDHAEDIKNATTAQEIYAIIAKGNSDYPVRQVVTWDSKNNVIVGYQAVYDKVTDKFYQINMYDLPKGWIGVIKNANDIDWYYIKNDGKKVVEFLNINGTLWYFDARGIMMKGMVDVNGTMYYFEEKAGRDEGKLVPAEVFVNRNR